MSLDVYLEKRMPTRVYEGNVTHNLTQMADEAGIYQALWRPEEIECHIAEHLILILEAGLENLKSNPDYFKKYNPENGWGSYEVLINFVEEYLKACKENPDAKIRVWR